MSIGPHLFGVLGGRQAAGAAHRRSADDPTDDPMSLIDPERPLADGPRGRYWSIAPFEYDVSRYCGSGKVDSHSVSGPVSPLQPAIPLPSGAGPVVSTPESASVIGSAS